MSNPRRSATPFALIPLAVLGVLLFLTPLIGLLARTPWSRLGSLLTGPVVRDALTLSLITSILAAAIAVAIGVPLAWILARVDFRGRAVMRALVMLPMVLPPVVGGTALLYAFGRRGLVGEAIYGATGFVLPFSMWGVVLANVFVATPFLVLTVEGAIRNLDPRYESAAAVMGAGRWRVFSRVTLPMIWPSLAAGALLAWARALGEFGATITFAGNLQGRTQTMPLAVFVALEQDRDVAIALSLVLIAVSFGVLVALRDRWWRAT